MYQSVTITINQFLTVLTISEFKISIRVSRLVMLVAVCGKVKHLRPIDILDIPTAGDAHRAPDCPAVQKPRSDLAGRHRQ